jgi:hypothetical protein
MSTLKVIKNDPILEGHLARGKLRRFIESYRTSYKKVIVKLLPCLVKAFKKSLLEKKSGLDLI